MALDQISRERLAAAIVATVIVISSTLLRLWCKVSFRLGLHTEDWLMFTVMWAYMAATSVDIWGLYKGQTGKQLSEIAAAMLLSPSPENAATLENYLKSLYIAAFISPIGLTLIRISICLFYMRIFSTKSFRNRSMVVIGLSIAWMISAFVVDLCFCFPLDKFWIPIKPGRCIASNLYFLLIGVTETLIDTAVLALPVRAIFSVQLPLKTKLSVAGIFLLGIFAIITNALRIYHIYSPNSIDISISQSTIWTHIHSTSAVVCANLPIYKPLTKRFGGFVIEVRSWFNSSFISIRSKGRNTIEDSEDSFHSAYRAPTFGHHNGTEKQGYEMSSRYQTRPSPTWESSNPYEGANSTMAWRSEGSADLQAVPSRSIVHTRAYEVV